MNWRHLPIPTAQAYLRLAWYRKGWCNASFSPPYSSSFLSLATAFGFSRELCGALIIVVISTFLSNVFSFFPFRHIRKLHFPGSLPIDVAMWLSLRKEMWAEGMCVSSGWKLKNQYTSCCVPFSVLWLSWKQVR